MRKKVCLATKIATATIKNILLLYRFEHHRLMHASPDTKLSLPDSLGNELGREIHRMVISFIAQVDPERQNTEGRSGYVCIHCKRVSTDRSNWFEFKNAEFNEGSILKNTLCAACSKALFPKFYK